MFIILLLQDCYFSHACLKPMLTPLNIQYAVWKRRFLQAGQNRWKCSWNEEKMAKFVTLAPPIDTLKWPLGRSQRHGMKTYDFPWPTSQKWSCFYLFFPFVPFFPFLLFSIQPVFIPESDSFTPKYTPHEWKCLCPFSPRHGFSSTFIPAATLRLSLSPVWWQRCDVMMMWCDFTLPPLLRRLRQLPTCSWLHSTLPPWWQTPPFPPRLSFLTYFPPFRRETIGRSSLSVSFYFPSERPGFNNLTFWLFFSFFFLCLCRAGNMLIMDCIDLDTERVCEFVCSCTCVCVWSAVLLMWWWSDVCSPGALIRGPVCLIALEINSQNVWWVSFGINQRGQIFSLITWNRVYLQGLLTGRRREPFFFPRVFFCTLFTRKFSWAQLCCRVDVWQARSSQAISARWGGTRGFLFFVEAKAAFAVHILHWTFYWMPQAQLQWTSTLQTATKTSYLAWNAINDVTVWVKFCSRLRSTCVWSLCRLEE